MQSLLGDACTLLGSNKIQGAPTDRGGDYNPNKNDLTSFQNGLIKKKISQKLNIFVGDYDPSRTVKGSGNESLEINNGMESLVGTSEQFDIFEDLKMIEDQMKNLQDIYGKNQEVLRQIKFEKKETDIQKK